MASINNEQRPGQNDEDIKEEPPTKKLRSVEPDLKIIVGDPPNECEYWYHSIIMAAQSGFIDTLLASPMKESISREIKFPDVEPKTWALAMKYLDLREGRKMKMEDAVKIVELYDKYEFHQGLNVCGDVIAEDFKEALTNKNTDLRMLDLFVQAFVLCDSSNLSVEAKEAAFEYFHTILSDRTLRMVFSEKQLERIIPVLCKVEKTLDRDAQKSVFRRFSAADIANPMFVRLVMKEWELATCYDDLVEKTPSIEACNLPEKFRQYIGTYHARRLQKHGLYFEKSSTDTGEAASERIMMLRDRLPFHGFAGWYLGIVERSHPNSILPMWYVPNSMRLPLPPENGWMPVNAKAVEGTSLRIKYNRPPRKSSKTP